MVKDVENSPSGPTGGVITIIVDASEIDDKYIDQPQNPTTGGGGFNASVENWGNEYNASVTI